MFDLPQIIMQLLALCWAILKPPWFVFIFTTSPALSTMQGPNRAK